jgi:hypothetical protein
MDVKIIYCHKGNRRKKKMNDDLIEEEEGKEVLYVNS